MSDLQEQIEQGRKHLKRGRYHKAVLCYQRAFEDPSLRAPALHGLGVSFMGLGYLMESETAYRTALKVLGGRDPNLEKKIHDGLARLAETSEKTTVSSS